MPNFIQKTKFLVLLIVAIKIWMGSYSLVSAHLDTSLGDKNFNSLAEQIINGLDSSLINEFTFRSGYTRPGIEISSFTKTKLEADPLLTNLANEFNSSLLAALIRKTEGRFKFFSSSNLQSNRGAKASCVMGVNCRARGKTSVRQSEADILIIGSLRVSERHAFLSYKAISIGNGLILAATSTIKTQIPPNILKTRYSHRDIHPVNLRSTIMSGRADVSCPNVHYLRNSLADLGYYSEVLSEKSWLATRMAIKAYQWHHNLPETGEYSCELARHVRSEISAKEVD